MSSVRDRESSPISQKTETDLFVSSMTSLTDEVAESFAIETAELIGSHHLAKTGTPARQWGTGRLNPATNEFTYTYATDREGVKQLKEKRDPEGVFQSPMGQQTHSKLLQRNANATWAGVGSGLSA